MSPKCFIYRKLKVKQQIHLSWRFVPSNSSFSLGLWCFIRWQVKKPKMPWIFSLLFLLFRTWQDTILVLLLSLATHILQNTLETFYIVRHEYQRCRIINFKGGALLLVSLQNQERGLTWWCFRKSLYIFVLFLFHLLKLLSKTFCTVMIFNCH